jgi:formylglycine-generating enzyme required for sulfatase activity
VNHSTIFEGAMSQGSKRADRCEANSPDPGLAAVLETSRTNARATISAPAGKKSQPKPAVLLATLALTVAVVGLAALGRAAGLAPPSADEQKRLLREVDEVYKPGEAKDQAAKAALARKLLEDGRKNEANRAEQFVLLRRSEEIARDAGEADLMLEAVDAMVAAGFNIQPLQAKSRLLARLVEQGSSGGASQLSTVIASCVRFAEQGAASGATDEAFDVLGAANKSLLELKKRAQTAYRTAQASARTRNPSDKAAREKKAQVVADELEAIAAAQAAVADCAKGLQQARREHEALLAAQERLKTEPDDPGACLAVGYWYCGQGDWDEGLKLLAKGSDDALKALAAEELASKPAKAEDKVARGDAWWDLAEKAAGKPKAAMRRRADHWYKEAMPDLAPGLGKSRVEKRLAQADDEPLPQADGGPARIRPPLAAAPFNEKTAKQHQARWAKYLRLPVVQTNSIGMKLVLIPPGEFDMGSPKDLIEWMRRDDHSESLPREGPQHRVRITKPYWLGATKVTQEEYQRVMGNNPSKAQGDPKRPVEQVSWGDAVEFCRKLSELPGEKAHKRRYALPTEAQWEYACRAGNPGRRYFSGQPNPFPAAVEDKLLSEHAWWGDNANHQTHPVAQKLTNPWGLYDLYGNVSEWCQDWYAEDYYTKSPTDDPTGPDAGGHTKRGGSFRDGSQTCRSASRSPFPGWPSEDIGFRVCMVPAEQASPEKKPEPPGSDGTAPPAPKNTVSK